MTTSPTTDPDCGLQSSWYRLLPGPTFAAETVAALLDVSIAHALTVIDTSLTAGVLVPVDSGGQDVITRYELPVPPQEPGIVPDDDHDDEEPGIVLPDNDHERAAVLRVLHHLAAHLLGVEQRLNPDTYRSPDLAELPGIPTFADDVTAMNWFTAERPTVLTAQRLATAMGEDVLVRHFGEATWTASVQAGSPQDVLALQSMAAEAGQRLGDSITASTALARASWALLQLGRYDDAAEAADHALDLADRQENNRARSIAFQALGDACRARRRYGDALEYYEYSRDVTLSAAGLAPDGVTATLPFALLGQQWMRTSLVYLDQGNITDATTAALAALAHIAVKPRCHRALAEARLTLARAMLADNRPAAAIIVLEAAQALLTPAVEPALLAEVLVVLGDAELAASAPNAASRHLRTAIVLFDHAGRDQRAQAVRERLRVPAAAATSPASE